MSRRGGNYVRKILPDPYYNDLTLAKFINNIMVDGKKSLAQRNIYKALEYIVSSGKITNDKNLGKKEFALHVFHTALDNVRPLVEVKTKRVGGANYQVPVEVRPGRREALGFRWIMTYATSRPGKSMSERLADEIIDAYHNRGAAIKKRDDVHKMAESNRAFAHYRW